MITFQTIKSLEKDSLILKSLTPQSLLGTKYLRSKSVNLDIFGTKIQIVLLEEAMKDNGYLLYGKLLKRGKFLRRTKLLFNAQNQQEFTSEASFHSKFKLILALFKNFVRLKSPTCKNLAFAM